MKNILSTIAFLLLLIFKLSAQTAPTDMIGKWEVVGFQVDKQGLSKAEQDKVRPFETSFLKSHFEFKQDHYFSFDFEKEEMQIKNAHWKYNELNHSYLIQEWADKDKEKFLLVEIVVKEENGKLFFLLQETPFILEVRKMATIR